MPSKCWQCKKWTCRCALNGKGTPEKEKVKIKDKNNRTRTVTRNTGNSVRGGIVWCGTCSSRVINGRCTNFKCSSR